MSWNRFYMFLGYGKSNYCTFFSTYVFKMQQWWMRRCVERLYTAACVNHFSYGLFISIRRKIQSGGNLERHHWNSAWCHMCNWVFRRGHIYRCAAQSRGRIPVRNLRDWEFRVRAKVFPVYIPLMFESVVQVFCYVWRWLWCEQFLLHRYTIACEISPEFR